MVFQYEVRPYQESDIEKSVDLLNILFDGWPSIDVHSSAVDYFRWKYHENPHGLTTGIISLDKDKLIASTHTFLYNIKIREQVYLGGIGADAGVHPDYRRQGIYNAIGKTKYEYEKEKGLGIRLHSSQNPILIERSKRRANRNTGERAKFPTDLSTLIKIVDVDFHFEHNPRRNQWIQKRGYQFLSTYNRIINRVVNTNSEIQTRSISIFHNDFETFWDQISKHYDFIIERNAAHLNWRFSKNAGEYKIIIAEEADELVGYIVTRINRINPDYPRGFIVDLLTIDNRLDIANVLFENAFKELRLNNVNSISWLGLKNDTYDHMLKSFGFVEHKVGFHLFYNTYIELEKPIENIHMKRVYLSYADFDVM